MLFYLLFAVCLYLPKHWRLGAMSGVLILLAIGGALFSPTNAVLATVSSPLGLEFLAGVWVAEFFRRGMTVPPAIATAMLIAGFGVLLGSQIWGEHPRLLVWGLPAVAIVGAAAALDTSGKQLHVPALVLLGDASYSIYLWHDLTISAVFKLGGVFGVPGPAAVVIGIVAGVCVGLVSYYLLERPLLRRQLRLKTT